MDPPAPADPWPQLQRKLLRYARSKVHNRALAEDAVSETMVATLQSGMCFDSAGHQHAWMVGVLKHKLADELRRQARWLPLQPDAEAGPVNAPDHGDPAAACALGRLQGALHAGCLQLPPLQRAAFTLRELAELQADEVCDRLGITRNHLGVLVHRARRRLTAQLQAHR